MKRIRKIGIVVLTIFALVSLFCVPAAAAEGAGEGFAGAYPRLIDAADLLSDAEEEILLDALNEVSERQKLEVVIVTAESLKGNNIVSFTDDLYDDYQFGYGAGKDGVMLFISIGDSEWYINTCGYGITAFTDAGIQYIGTQMKSELSDRNFAKAFQVFIQNCDEFITQARTDRPFDKSNLPREPLSAIWLPISLVAGTIIAVVVVGLMKAELKTVRFQPRAKDYVRTGSLNVTQSRDLFLYRTVNRTEKPQKKNQGSSTHISSSGRKHGGGGGKF